MREFSTAADPQQHVIIEFLRSGGVAEFEPLRPFDLDRRHREKQRSWKIALAADRRLRDGFLGGEIGKPLRKIGRRKRLDRHEIDRPGHRGFQAIGGEARDGPDAGFAGGEFCPIVRLPEPSDVTTPMPVTTTIGLPNLSRVAVIVPVRRRAYLIAFDQRHAFAPPVTGPDDDNLGRRFATFQSPVRSYRWMETARRAKSTAPRGLVQRKLGFHGVPEQGSGGPAPQNPDARQERPFLRGGRFGAGRTGDDGTLVFKPAKLRP